MQSQAGHNMPCVNVNVHNRDSDNDHNMTTSLIPSSGVSHFSFASSSNSSSNQERSTETTTGTTTVVSPSLVSLDSYGVFPVGSNKDNDNDNMDVDAMVLSPYHGDDDTGHGGSDYGLGVATGHTTTSTASDTTANGNYRQYGLNDDKPLDDLDLMLQHQDFSLLVTLAVKVKQARAQVAEACGSGNGGGGGSGGASKTRQASSSLEPSDVVAAVSRLQDQLLWAGPNNDNNNNNNNKSTSRQVIPRGVFPITDSIMDDSLETLQKELDRCHRCLEQATTTTSNAMTTTEPTPTVTASNKNTKTAQKKHGRNKKDAIAVKYSKWQTDILMNWMIENKDQPFPDQDEIKKLMHQTGLLHSQVVNWTTNVRKRNRKATCQGGKKPHHFIDFLFLAQDRESRQKRQQGQEQQQHYHHQHQPRQVKVKVEDNGDDPTPYLAPSYHQQQQQQQQVKSIKVESNDDAPTPYSSSSYQQQHHDHQQRHQQKQQQPQQRRLQEAYPSPKQLQSSSSLYSPPDLPRFTAHTDTAYHYHHHRRHTGHPGSPSYPRNRPNERTHRTHENTWNAPFGESVQSGGSSALEPLLIDDLTEVVLLDDFSSFWLEDKPHQNHDNHAMTFKSNSDKDLVDVLEYHQHQHHYTNAPQDVHVQPLMPSVTDDQDAAAMPDYPQSNKRMRIMPVDHVDLDELDELKLEDINDWAADLGFVVEI